LSLARITCEDQTSVKQVYFMRNCLHFLGLLLIATFTMLLSPSAAAQNAEVDKKIKKADALLNVKEYKQALPIYLEIDKLTPNDPLNHYAIGVCYTSLPGEEAKAVPYLLTAVKSKNTDVPPRAQLLLAKAYHQNGQFDEAIAVLKAYKTIEKKPEFLAEATLHLSWSTNGKALTEQPADVYVQNMGAPVNTAGTEYGPVISADEKVLVYTTYKQGAAATAGGKATEYEDVMMSAKSGNNWSAPQSLGITPPVITGVRNNIGSVGLSPDGQKLLVYMGATMNSGDIYACQLQGDKWGAPGKLGKEVNSTFEENSASYTPDEKVVYFASNRPGGQGGMDIWKVEKQIDGVWGSPVNLGPTVNTKHDEQAPFIHPDKKTLYFTSNSPNSMGGYDIFKTVLDKGKWTVPANMGSPINTQYNDKYFALSADGKKGYFSSDRPEGKGGYDIYFLGIPEELGVVPLTMMKGRILAGDPPKPVRTKIKVIDKSTNEIIKDVYNPNAKTGDYLVIFPPNRNYDLVIEAEGFKPYLVNIYVPNQDYFYELYQEILLNPITKDGKVVGQGISVKNAFHDVEQENGAKANNTEVYALMGKLLSSADSSALNALLESVYADPVDVSKMTKNEEATKSSFMYADASGKLHPFVVGKDTLYTMAAVNTMAKTAATATVKKETITKETVLKLNQIYIVYFDTDKSNLKSEAIPELDKVHDFLKKNPSYGIKIAGYTDSDGTKDRNQVISESRAKAVAAYLVNKGITNTRTLARGYGQNDPLNTNATEDEKRLNRRVEITLVELRAAN
jgi:outer membrane protein OmpA-like peptidoglycan-associated protein